MSIIISKEGKNAQKVDKTDIEKENFMQQYIHENPEAIPVYEIEEDKKLFVMMREYRTESGPIDALAIDKDGDIYVVETKLYKNPDKRTVVAQALDYGASLWRHGDYNELISKINYEINKKFQVTFEEKIKTFFDIDEETVKDILEAIKINLQQGNIKFVILMDDIEDKLKDLIIYINQNSQFDIYAVQMEYYKFEKYEIMIPKLFGVEVKKNISTSSSGSLRKKWDEQRFFEEIKKNLDNEKSASVKKLYEFTKQKNGVIWGTGTTRGSFSGRFPILGTRPLFVLESDGVLKISFDYPKKEASVEQIANMEKLEKLMAKTNLQVEKSTNRTFFEPEKWMNKVDEVIKALEEILK